MSSPQEVTSNLELQISLSDIFGVLISRWQMLISITVLFCVIGIFYAISLPNIYRASVLLAEASDENQFNTAALPGGIGGAMAGIAGLSIGRSSASVDRALAVLKSRKFVSDFIDSQNLLPVLFEENWDRDKKTWLDNNEPNQWQSYRRFIALLNTSTSTDGLVTITLEHTDQFLVADLLNSLVSYLNNVMRQEGIDEAREKYRILAITSPKRPA